MSEKESQCLIQLASRIPKLTMVLAPSKKVAVLVGQVDHMMMEVPVKKTYKIVAIRHALVTTPWILQHFKQWWWIARHIKWGLF